MLSLISPAKKLLTKYSPYTQKTTEPVLNKKANELAKLMKEKSAKEIAALMDLSADLAQLNFQRYQDFMLRKQDSPESYPAVYLFQGDVYQGLQAATWDDQTVNFSQDHLAILSGLYGVLKPLDRIQPYRLEMGVHLKNAQGNTLYDFWQDSITKTLKKQLQTQENPILINLASSEYFKSVKSKALGYPIITINFYEMKNDEPKMIGIHAKKARGTMAKFLMENEIDEVAGIKRFKELGYQFSKELSTDDHLDFVRG